MFEESDIGALAAEFKARRRVVVPNFIPEKRALALRDELAGSLAWRHVISGGGALYEIGCREFDELPLDTRDAIGAALHAEATTQFRFQYDVIRVPERHQVKTAPADRLNRFARHMNSAAVLSVLRRVTGFGEIAFADAQATRYRAGDFLTRHDDDAAGSNRVCAYVLGLSSGWRAEWGGLLLFNDPSGGIARAVVPQFDSLSLFAVPQPHSVSFVAPYAGNTRLSVTGWLRTR